MASRTWFGRAFPVNQVEEVTVGGTYAADDTITLTINGKDLTLTIGTTVAAATILDNLVRMLQGTTSSFDTGYSSNLTGVEVGEFSSLTYSEDGSTKLIITGRDDGQPFTLTVSRSTSASGTIGTSTATSPTGPHHFDNADNWSGDTVPVDGDTIIFDDSSDSDLLYALSTGIQPAVVTRTSGFEGRIGLPRVNTDDAQHPYDEYRETYLTFANDAGTSTTTITIGERDGDDSGRTNIDTADCTGVTLNVYNSGQREDDKTPALLFLSAVSTTVININRGDLGVAFFEGETAHVATLKVAHQGNPASDVRLYLGDGVDLADADIDIDGGIVSINSATGSGTIDIRDGEVHVLEGAHAAINVDGGTCFYRSSSTGTQFRVGNGGTLDFRRDPRARTATNCSLYAGGAIYDPFRSVTWTNGIDLVRCSIDDVDLDLGTDFTITPSDI